MHNTVTSDGITGFLRACTALTTLQLVRLQAGDADTVLSSLAGHTRLERLLLGGKSGTHHSPQIARVCLSWPTL